MLDEIRFSAAGASPTTFEVRLLMTAADKSPVGQFALRVAQQHGPQVAAKIVCLLLDELAGERISVPSRRDFFDALWRDERTALILALAAKPDYTRADIARLLGVDPAVVTRTCNGGQTRKPRPGKPRP